MSSLHLNQEEEPNEKYLDLSLSSGAAQTARQDRTMHNNGVRYIPCKRQRGQDGAALTRPNDLSGAAAGMGGGLQYDHGVMYGRFSCKSGENGKKIMSYYGNNERNEGVSYRQSSSSSSHSEKIRHRMIKNRESAARSRARKQALEAQQQLENAELKKENDLLKRIVGFLLGIVRTKRTKLPTLSRSFSAPF
ncbi:bZIP transcription factor ABI5 homolog [Mercurialis annua]|uniref:bZIP transcription factor ABI5 homolog n=1 Tax=Mercurialis annua TaxID=3986 RepID=UPI00215F2187|nr:bZIP transcription factor ABI5 homolog [Mercurialis annua]